jgi:uroporphyrinogen-III synthase
MTLRMISFESRRNREMADLIEKSGGQALVAPALQEVPLRENHEVLFFGQKLMSGEIDGVVFTTGSGVETFFDILTTRFSAEQLFDAFSKTMLLARGPKPLAALRQRGFQDIRTTEEPATSREVLKLLDQGGPLRGKTIAVQE